MTLTLRWYCITVLVSTMGQPAMGQTTAPVTNTPPSQTFESLESLSTLESIRMTNTGSSIDTEGGSGMAGGMGGGGSEFMGPSSGKRLLLQHINQLRLLLNEPNQDRKELEPMLREALAEYFVLDMEERVREFDKIKARVIQM